MNSSHSLYVIVHQYSDYPWQDRIYSSAEEAYMDVKFDSNKSTFFILTLKDFFWQVNNKKLSPNAVKVTSMDQEYVQGN
jgi:hypothetical protein